MREIVEQWCGSLEAKAMGVASTNGASPDRDIERMRYEAGRVAGLLEAAEYIRQQLKAEDDEDQ